MKINPPSRAIASNFAVSGDGGVCQIINSEDNGQGVAGMLWTQNSASAVNPISIPK